MPNDEGSKLYTAGCWIDEGWEHVTGSGLAKSLVVFAWSLIIDHLMSDH